ncbi:MAG: hypothetical protein AB1651_03695 [Pseudomonadota bacterium]
MKKSFFGRFKSHLKQDFGGRYLGAVLAECINAEPGIAKTLWGISIDPRHHAVTAEWVFPGKDKGRRADLVVLKKKDRQLVALAEIKYEDHKLDSTGAQLKDYLDLVERQSGLAFVYLTKHAPKHEDKWKVQQAGHRAYTYGDLFQALHANKGLRGNHTAQLLMDFLREEGYVFTQNIDAQDVKALIAQTCGFPQAAGLGKLFSGATYERTTDALQQILANAAVLGDSFYEQYGAVAFGNRPFTRFTSLPWINKTGMKLLAKELDDYDEVYLPRRSISGGSLFVWSQMRFAGKSGWMYLYIEQSYELSTGTDHKLKIRLGGTIDTERARHEHWRKVGLNTTLDKLREVVRQLVKASLGDALADQAHFGGDKRKALAKLRSAMA